MDSGCAATRACTIAAGGSASGAACCGSAPASAPRSRGCGRLYGGEMGSRRRVSWPTRRYRSHPGGTADRGCGSRCGATLPPKYRHLQATTRAATSAATAASAWRTLPTTSACAAATSGTPCAGRPLARLRLLQLYPPTATGAGGDPERWSFRRVSAGADGGCAVSGADDTAGSVPATAASWRVTAARAAGCGGDGGRADGSRPRPFPRQHRPRQSFRSFRPLQTCWSSTL